MKVNPVDKYVGLKLKIRRIYLGISQNKIGEMTNVTFQQIQKYEKGTNRIGCSRLYEFAKILRVPISYFFDGYENSNSITSIISDDIASISLSDDNIEEKEVLSLIKSFTKIKSKNIRKNIISLIKSLNSKNNNIE